VDAGGNRCLGTAQVGHQCHHGKPGQRQGVPHHVGNIGHLRQQPGRHKGANFNFTQAGTRKGIQPGHLVRGGHGGLDALQPVARAHFTDQNCIHWVEYSLFC